jgi:hypothetical protein
MDPLECIEQAVQLIDDAEQVVARGAPAGEGALATAEREIGFRFPPSYRASLSAVGPICISYGPAGLDTFQVYGLTGERTGLPNVVWLYGLGTTGDARLHLGIAQRRSGSWPFAGPEFALDLGQIEPTTGEPTVVSAEGGPSFGEPIARDFGLWLLASLEEVVPLSVEMWNLRKRHSEHLTTTEEYGQPGPAVYVSKCGCGWSSHLAPEAVSRTEAARHSSHPEEMRALPHWH